MAKQFSDQDLYNAIQSADFEALEKMHLAGHDWNQPLQKDDAIMPIFIAAGPDTMERFAVMKWLIERGADINVNADGTTIWAHVSMDDGHYADPDEGFCLGDMISLGANIHTVATYGSSALRTAIVSGRTDIVEDLVSRGVNLCTNLGETDNVWTLAARRGDMDMLTLLAAKNVPINAGIDLATREEHESTNWQSPLLLGMDDQDRPLCFNVNDEDIIDLLIAAGGSLLDPSFGLAIKRPIDLVNADFSSHGFRDLMEYAAAVELRKLPAAELIANVSSLQGARRVASALNMQPETLMAQVAERNSPNKQHFFDVLVAGMG